jgi:hypothetical protein
VSPIFSILCDFGVSPDFVEQAGRRGAFDVEEDRRGLRVFRIPEIEARGEMSIVSPDSLRFVSPDSAFEILP